MEGSFKKDFEKTWFETADRMRAYMFCACGRWNDAEDLMQNCYLRALQHWGQFNGTGSRQAWLFTIARTTYIDFLRSQKRKSDSTNDQKLQKIAHKKPSQSNEQQAELVWNAINDLSIEYREVIHLRFAAGLDYKEISDSLKIPIGTVRSRLHRGLKAIREQIGDRNNET
jgi:RNA polymerase sigma-70 factor (ECF subfamily)